MSAHLKDRLAADLDALAGATEPRCTAGPANRRTARLQRRRQRQAWPGQLLGELLAIFGAFDPADGLSRPAFITYMVWPVSGTSSPPYLPSRGQARPWATQQPAPVDGLLADLRPYEAVQLDANWPPSTLLAGLWPAPTARTLDPAVKHLLGVADAGPKIAALGPHLHRAHCDLPRRSQPGSQSVRGWVAIAPPLIAMVSPRRP